MPTNQIDTYEVEVGENQSRPSGTCKLDHSFVAHGFVYKNTDARAVYYAAWPISEENNSISFAIAIGEWDDSSNTRDRTCFGLRATESENEILFQVIDPINSPWGDSELLGKMLCREDALKSVFLEEVFIVTEAILRSHPALGQYLSLARPDSDQAPLPPRLVTAHPIQIKPIRPGFHWHFAKGLPARNGKAA